MNVAAEWVEESVQIPDPLHNERLFPKPGCLSGTDAESLASLFGHSENTGESEGAHEHGLRLANDLADCLDLPRRKSQWLAARPLSPQRP
jgi:hypothetical protein